MNQRWQRLKFWFTTRRVCCWCQPQHYLGGNPFARVTTGGMCPAAVRRMKEEVDSLEYRFHHAPGVPLSESEGLHDLRSPVAQPSEAGQ